MPVDDIYISGAQMLEDLAITRNGVATSVMSSSPSGSLSYTHTDATSESQVTSPSQSSTADRNGGMKHVQANCIANAWVPASAVQVKEPDAMSNGSGQAVHFTSPNAYRTNGHHYTSGGHNPEMLEMAKANEAAYIYNPYQLPDTGIPRFSPEKQRQNYVNGQGAETAYTYNAYQLPGNGVTHFLSEQNQPMTEPAQVVAPAVHTQHSSNNGQLSQAQGVPRTP